ncbi:MAG: OmpA family protein [Bacteroidales bacterium]|nr:OmpA family protein [Bacteroidales bacterium]
MKIKILFVPALMTLCFSSCVTLGKYEQLEATLNQQKKEHAITRQELLDMKDEYAAMQRQFQQQSADLTDMSNLKNEQAEMIKQLEDEIRNLQLGFDTVEENYIQKLSGTSRSLQEADKQLKALQEREKAATNREKALQKQQNELEQRYAELQKTEEASRRALEAKERELNNLRNSVTNALVGFKDKGLNVDVKDGKVYVSMESKLMFPSGSWTVSKEGMEAIQGLAQVLEENPDLNIMVEGHTDNVTYKGSGAVKDNWDLSVLRATSIVKLLMKYGPTIDPTRIEASGHGEFAPKVPNTSAENKAMNRRTEIILTPKLDDLLKAVE